MQTLERTKVNDSSHTILYTHAALPAKSPLRDAAALATAATLAASHGFPSVQKLLLFLKFQGRGTMISDSDSDRGPTTRRRDDRTVTCGRPIRRSLSSSRQLVYCRYFSILKHVFGFIYICLQPLLPPRDPPKCEKPPLHTHSSLAQCVALTSLLCTQAAAARAAFAALAFLWISSKKCEVAACCSCTGCQGLLERMHLNRI